MTRTHRFRNTLAALATGLALLTGHTASAQSMVSVKGNVLNMRSGPGTNTEVLWELRKGYPLKVVARQGNWLKVSDFENDRGWVARSLTGRTPHHS
ncbi:SH3 domain protein [Hydrogenophaga sp. T4]|nr:SH3 domain protein [Hydrogenophaga sp. T4]